VKIHDCEQRSPEWHALRAGKVTGSCAQAILQVRKKGTGELAIRRDLRQQLVVERLTGIAVEDMPYKGKDLQHGIDTEPLALAAYEAAYREIVTRIGFVEHDTLPAGCSPDGYVGDWEGVIEIKCPASSTHLDYRKADVIPEEYVGQLLHALWITGAQWADFVSYDPRFLDPSKRLFTKRLNRNAETLTAYELAVRLFLTEVETEVAALRPAEEVNAF
jgi:putative phage-type endonuclease